MSDTTFYEIELAWELMTPMEQALWGATMALHSGDADAGLGAADAAVTKLRALKGIRSHRPEPEYEAARAGFYMEFDEFVAWYSVERRIRGVLSKQGYLPPSTEEELSAAYERYARGRNDYY